MSNLLKKEKGFTLIEIVLVLAIAGLLLVIVFLALSGAQKSRRDSSRKNDASRIVSQIENYASNNGGTLPTTGATGTFATKVLASGSKYFDTSVTKDPSGTAYSPVTSAPAAAGDVWYQTASLCASSGGTATASNYSVTIYVEQGGTFCLDNH